MKTPNCSTAGAQETANSTEEGPHSQGHSHHHAGGEIITLGIATPQRREVAFAIRLLDLVCSFLVLLFVLPLFLIVALAIKLDSPGPVLFIQKRVGKDGREFSFFKFRSMVSDAEARRSDLEAMNERDGPVFKMRRDPRITRVGYILRKFSVDELPQLLNVVSGEMSLVGPRPALPSEVALYSPRQLHRLAVKPGVTGLWQVSGRSLLTFEHSIELDLHYIQNQSLLLNLQILYKTIPAVLSAEGAY